MITRIRDVRRAKGLTLEQVGALCDPPTTAQTIGRLETGTRTVSVKWLNRIAAALGVQAGDLVDMPGQAAVPVVALLGSDGARAPSRNMTLVPPAPAPELVGVQIISGVGDYRAGDALWCERLEPADFGRAVNRDVLIPRPAGRFVFGRLIGREGGLIHLLPLGLGNRQQVFSDPPWVAMAVRLIRAL